MRSDSPGFFKRARAACARTLSGLRPGRFPYRPFLVALVLGTSGGALFSLLHMPLAWMLGSMIACTAGSLAGMRITAPALIRPPLILVIGVLLGAGFSPEITSNLSRWIPTMIGLLGFLAIGGIICVAYLRYVARYNVTTAYFAGMPGGLTEMIILGDQQGGDVRTIALVHSARVLLVVSALPALLVIMGKVDLMTGPQRIAGAIVWSMEGLSWAIGSALVGALIGHVFRLPAKFLLGPMIVSAFVHTLGWSDFKPPVQLVNLAQLGLGTIVGCRFAGTQPRVVITILLHSLITSTLLIAVTLGFSFAVAMISGHDVMQLILSYSPGGLTEMSLIALALNLEVGFVAAHHIVRVFVVVLVAQLLFPIFKKKA